MSSRRGFFRTLFGGAAVAAVADSLPAPVAPVPPVAPPLAPVALKMTPATHPQSFTSLCFTSCDIGLGDWLPSNFSVPQIISGAPFDSEQIRAMELERQRYRKHLHRDRIERYKHLTPGRLPA